MWNANRIYFNSHGSDYTTCPIFEASTTRRSSQQFCRIFVRLKVIVCFAGAAQLAEWAISSSKTTVGPSE
jgi:hypothetical protein